MKNISATLCQRLFKTGTLKRFFILLPLSFILPCNLCNAQSPLQIQWVGSNDVCFSCVTLEVVNPQVGYTYEWLRADYSCQPMGNGSIAGTGSQIQACLTGEYLCSSTSPTGDHELSGPLRVRTLGSYLLPAPYSTNTVNCVSSLTLCIPWIFLTPFTSNTVITWYKNNVVINPATANYIYATSSGYYKYSITTNCIIAYSDSVHLTTLPAASIAASNPTTFCSGGSVVLNAPTGTNKTYQWKKGANLVSGATLSSYTATTGGNYKVIVTNTATGCSKTTASATVVTVNALPTATITPQGPTTFCAGGSVVLAANTGTGLSYKWKKGSNFISGATLSNYTATTGGNYKVQVTNSNGCSKISGNVAVSVPCKEGEMFVSVPIVIGFDVKVFPNPSSKDFVFEISNASSGKVLINVYDMIGKMVLSEITLNPQFKIRNPQLAPGIYSCEIICGENKKVLKLLKTD